MAGEDKRKVDKRKWPFQSGKIKNAWDVLVISIKTYYFGWIQAAVLTMVFAFLFYRSFFGLFCGLIVIPFWLRIYIKEAKKNELATRTMEFKEIMLLLSSSLQAGYSVEKAFMVMERELAQLFPKGLLQQGLHEMNSAVAMNIPIENAFMDFAKESEIPDASMFAEIFMFSKRGGGNYIQQVKNTAYKIEQKLGVQMEIETMMAQKVLELKIMCAMPLFILLYISITSFDFISGLYHNLVGVLTMTGCLVVYGLLVMLGLRIIDIKV